MKIEYIKNHFISNQNWRNLFLSKFPNFNPEEYVKDAWSIFNENGYTYKIDMYKTMNAVKYITLFDKDGNDIFQMRDLATSNALEQFLINIICDHIVDFNEFKSLRQIMVLENDLSEIPSRLKDVLNSEYEVWYNFNSDSESELSDKIQKFKSIYNNYIFYASPSFVGYGNSFEHYLFMLIELKNNNINIEIHILFDNLIDYIKSEVLVGNKSKQSALKNNLTDVLNYHNIFIIGDVGLKLDSSIFINQ